jgi:hypothetical protein
MQGLNLLLLLLLLLLFIIRFSAAFCKMNQFWTYSIEVCCRAFTRNSSSDKGSPKEERKPADHEGAHYDAQCTSCLVLGPPAGTLLSHSGACNKSTHQSDICIFMNVTEKSPLKSSTFCTREREREESPQQSNPAF